MLHCYPRNVFSRQYDVVAPGRASFGEVNIRTMTEQGSILWDGVEWDVNKHGPASGYWTLESGDTYFADAQKDSSLKRVMRIETKEHKLDLRPLSSISSKFEVLRDGQLVGSIKRASVFSRRAYVEFDADIPELLQLFCFWFVRLMWRRAMNG